MDDSIEAYQNGMEKNSTDYFTAEMTAGLQNFIQDFKEKRSLGENDDWISNLEIPLSLQGYGAGRRRCGGYSGAEWKITIYISSDQWHSS